MNPNLKPKFNGNGLIPVVVQNIDTGDILMVAWMNLDAFNLTMQTRFVHFWSRSRQQIWMKGETSGNTLALKEMWIDCDSDTLLVQVIPAGPVCHTGNQTCFFQKIDFSLNQE